VAAKENPGRYPGSTWILSIWHPSLAVTYHLIGQFLANLPYTLQLTYSVQQRREPAGSGNACRRVTNLTQWGRGEMQTPSHTEVSYNKSPGMPWSWLEQNETVAVAFHSHSAARALGLSTASFHAPALSKQRGCVYRFSSIYTFTYSSLSLIFQLMKFSTTGLSSYNQNQRSLH